MCYSLTDIDEEVHSEVMIVLKVLKSIEAIHSYYSGIVMTIVVFLFSYCVME